MTPQEQTAAKKQYAEILTRIPEPFAAALELYPDDTKIAAWIARNWPHDPEVIAAKKEIRNTEDLPNKTDLARAIWDKMQGPIMPDDFGKLAKIYAEVNGYIEKPGPGVIAQIIIPKVIEVPNHGTNEEWEAKAEKQQKDLLNVSRSKH